MSFVSKIKQFFCPHELAIEDGRWRCIHCLLTTDIAPIAPGHSMPLSSRDITELHDFLLDTEMSLCGGG